MFNEKDSDKCSTWVGVSFESSGGEQMKLMDCGRCCLPKNNVPFSILRYHNDHACMPPPLGIIQVLDCKYGMREKDAIAEI